jgi:dihydroxyacetone kinase
VKTIIIAALAVLAFSAVTADAAKSPSTRSIAKKALAVAQDANHTADANTVERDRKFAEQDAQNANTARDVQTANGNVSVLARQLATQPVHEHSALGTVAMDTKGTVTASCEPGEYVRSGGYEYDTNQGIDVPQPVVVSERAGSNISTYSVTLNNLGGTTNVALHVYANCVPV